MTRLSIDFADKGCPITKGDIVRERLDLIGTAGNGRLMLVDAVAGDLVTCHWQTDKGPVSNQFRVTGLFRVIGWYTERVNYQTENRFMVREHRDLDGESEWAVLDNPREWEQLHQTFSLDNNLPAVEPDYPTRDVLPIPDPWDTLRKG